MNLNEFLPVINGSLAFYQNTNGLITIDDAWHLPVIQLTILYNWERFARVVGQEHLWRILTSFNKSDRLYFFANGLPYNPPSGLVTLVTSERQQLIIKHVKKHSINRVDIALVCVILMLVTQVTYIITNLKVHLRAALTKD